MSTALPRAFAIIELLVDHRHGMPLSEVATALHLPKSAAHRLLSELVELGYLRQDAATAHYVLGMQLVSQALRHLNGIPLVDLARPTLDRLAEVSGELVRLSIADSNQLYFVVKVQGARSGLRYDPNSGRDVKLARTSSGLAWLSTMERERMIELLEGQGFDDLHNYGPEGPNGLDETLELIGQVRHDGYCYTDSTYELGTATIALPIVGQGHEASAVLAIAGPSVRLTRERALLLLPDLAEAAQHLSMLSSSVPQDDELRSNQEP